jgi:two-component system, OmpR family, sensor histidine kinase ChvG
MNASPGIDVKAARPARQAGVVLGEDWVGPDAKVESELRARRERRGLIAINRSPLARKIITFNLLAILVLVAGVLYLNPFRDSLVMQRERGLVTEAELIARIVEAQLPDAGQVSFPGADGRAAL